MEIKSISKNLFGAKQKTTDSSHTNPFGVSFQGNVMKADVFIPAGDGLKAAGRGKTWASAMVGSMNSFNEAICGRLNSVMDFGRRIGTRTSDLWKQAQSIDVTEAMKNMGTSIKSSLAELSDLSVSNLRRRPTSVLSNIFEDAIAARGIA